MVDEFSMSVEKQLGLRGPITLAVGGTFVVFSLLVYSYLLYEGSLSFPNTGNSLGIMLYVCSFVFFGLIFIGMGLQMILRDSK